MHKLHPHSKLAGRRKLTLPKKAVIAPSGQSGQGTSGANRNISLTGAPTVIEATQDSSRNSSGSSSSLNLNSWDGIIDYYLDDLTNNNLQQSYHSESSQGLSVRGTADSPHLSSQLSVHTDLREIINIPVSAEAQGSQDNPILIDSIPESTANPTIQLQQSRPSRNVGPPQFYRKRRFIDVVLENDDTGTAPSSYVTSPGNSRPTFTVSSPSDFLTPLAEAPPRQTLIAETTLTWPTKNSCPSVRPVNSPNKTLFNENSSGLHSAHQDQ